MDIHIVCVCVCVLVVRFLAELLLIIHQTWQASFQKGGGEEKRGEGGTRDSVDVDKRSRLMERIEDCINTIGPKGSIRGGYSALMYILIYYWYDGIKKKKKKTRSLHSTRIFFLFLFCRLFKRNWAVAGSASIAILTNECWTRRPARSANGATGLIQTRQVNSWLSYKLSTYRIIRK